MKKILISILLVISISFATVENVEVYDEFNNIMYRNEIDLDSKSTKGWIRLFNSIEKINNYGYSISEYERLLIITELKERMDKSIKKYKRGVE